MESIYVCAGTIVCSLILCTIFKMISPSTNLSRTISVVLGIFALLCFISPLQKLVTNIEAKSFSNTIEGHSEDIEGKYNKEVLSLTGEYINKYIHSLIYAENIKTENITTSVAHSENNGIYVKEVCIYLTDEQTKYSDKIKEIILSAVCVEPKIVVVNCEEQ